MAISVRVRHLPAAKYGGQRRHDLRLGPQPNYVDPERSPDNRTLVEPSSPAEMRRNTLQRRSRGRPRRSMRSDSAIATTAIITFGKGVQPLISGAAVELQDAAYRAVADAICRRYDVGLRGLVVHADEAAPHAHAIFDCRSGDGRAVSKQLRGAELQDLAAAAIRPHFPEVTRGVRRAIRKEAGEPKSKWVHRSVRRLHQDLPSEIAGLETKAGQIREETAGLDALRTAAEDALKAARDREAEMEARVRELEAKEASLEEGLTEREAKRLETYRKRRGERREELRKAEEDLADVQEQVKASEAARDAARKETEALMDRPLSDAGLLTGGLREKEREIENRAIREAARKGDAYERREKALKEEFATRTQDLETQADERAAELDRRESAIGEAAEELAGRTATAVQVIAEELVEPYPDPGDWRQSRRFDQDRWDRVGPKIGNEGGCWPARIWGKLRDLHTQVRAALDAAADRIAALTAERDAAVGKVAALSADLAAAGTARNAVERERDTAKAGLATALPPAEARELRGTSAHRLLIMGAMEGSPGMIDRAIKEGADPDRKSDFGHRGTALHLAVLWAKPAAIRRLLKAGADASVKDANGQTPADMARTMEGKVTGPAMRKLLREIIEVLDPPKPDDSPSLGM